MDHVARVILAREGQRFPHVPTLFHVTDYPAPQFAIFFQQTDITDAEETFLGPGQRDANSVFSLKEADFPLFIASNERKQNDIVFFSLEVVHGTDSHTTEEIFGHFFLELD